MKSSVSRIPIASSSTAISHFQSLLSVETDCWDVHHAIENRLIDFVLLDVRSEVLYREGHLPQSINLPHHWIKSATIQEFVNEQLFVVYCAGPHCNGADKAALKLAQLGKPVKKMIGGVTGWIDEGFSLLTS